VNHHPLAIDVADSQASKLGVPYSGGVKRHEQNAMAGSERGITSIILRKWVTGMASL
jgi:hypothetical protein